MSDFFIGSLKVDDQFYQDIDANLESSRKAFVQSSIAEEEAHLVRSTDEARLVLNLLKSVHSSMIEILSDYPSLESLYDKAFGPIHELIEREAILETCFLDTYLFPHRESYSFLVDNIFNVNLVESYSEIFKAWCSDKKDKHVKTQELIKDKFDLKIQSQDLECSCVQCLGDYRTRLRETVVQIQVKMIDDAEEKLHKIVLVRSISDIAQQVFNLRKNLEKTINQVRYKFKRSTLNKLESEIKAHFRSKFASHTVLGKVYREKLMVFFNTQLVEVGLKPELVSLEEYDRFFLQLEINIWKPEAFLKVEFEKFTRAILALKRKDVSSGILREYLGQFWLHAEARKINRKFIYHMGPTNSGKTYHAIEALCKASKGCYLAPLRLLASELFDTMNAKGVKTTLLTGEEVVEVADCTHYSSTIEMAKLNERFDCCVIDEVQMLTDPQRGWAWTRALISINADEVHLCGDHTVLELVKNILVMTGDTLEIKEYTRMTSLEVMKEPIILSQLERGDALIVFSRKNALKYKADLENLDFKVSIVYGRLSPEVRREQARKFDMGETDIIVSTDAIAMGMNLPVRRIVFSALAKFFDEKEQPLTFSEIKQISGRAGRFNRFPNGYVTTLTRVENGLRIIHEALNFHLNQSDKAMVGPDLDIYNSVNHALEINSLPILSLSEFLRLFNTMTFKKPFFCTDLKEMIELAEMVEGADEHKILSSSEIFGFACAPVNLGLVEHVQYYLWILNHFANNQSIQAEPIETESDDIDYLETAIKCVELFQWLARHFSGKNFEFNEQKLLENKTHAVEKLNSLLSEKTTKTCSSCGCKLPTGSRFAICDTCFSSKRKSLNKPQRDGAQTAGSSSGSGGKRPDFRKGGASRRKTRASDSFKKYR